MAGLRCGPWSPTIPPRGPYFKWCFSGELPQDASRASTACCVGFAIGTGWPCPSGLVHGRQPVVYELFNPLIQVLRPIPPIAYIPLSILWFGLGNPPAIFLISIGAFFPVLMNTVTGVRNVDSIYLRVAPQPGRLAVTQFRRIILPAATPYIFTGARIGMGTAFIVVIVAEMIAVNNGLGYRILEAREYFWSDKIIAGMITIGLAGPGHRHGHEPPELAHAALAPRSGAGMTDMSRSSGSHISRAAASTRSSRAAARRSYALKAIDLEIARGEFVCLLGPLGLRQVHPAQRRRGLQPAHSGAIDVDGAPVTAPGRTAAWCSRSTRCSPG